VLIGREKVCFQQCPKVTVLTEGSRRSVGRVLNIVIVIDIVMDYSSRTRILMSRIEDKE